MTVEYRTCLLLEDDSDDADFFIETLHSVSSKVGCHAASNGHHGLQILESGIRPDLIFTDINMPLMDGYEFIERVRSREQFRDIPIIVYSSRRCAEHKSRLRELDVIACYQKGDASHLFDMLSRYFRQPRRVSIL